MTKVYLAPRMLACEEDVSLLRAIHAVGWWVTQCAWRISHVQRVQPADLKIDPGLFSRFPAMPDCCRKALYAMVLSRLRQMLPCAAPLNDGTLIPQQWALPRQKELLREHCNSKAAEAAATGAQAHLHCQA